MSRMKQQAATHQATGRHASRTVLTLPDPTPELTRSEPARRPPAGWVVCRGCQSLVYQPRWQRSLGVCPHCGKHAPVPAMQRLQQLADPGSVELLPAPSTPADPLRFTDRVPYRDRLAAAREQTGLDEAVVCARVLIHGRPAVLAVMDFGFLGGSLGTGVGERITLAAEHALDTRTALVIVTASGGARMQEGPLSLMQMAKTAQALAALDEAGVLTVTLATDPTYGGVAASFATLTDLIFVEPGARMGFAGPRVIEQTTGASLPPGFQTAEFLLAHGLVDAVLPRASVRATLGSVLAAAYDRPPLVPDVAGDPLVRCPDQLTRRPAWETVRLGRNLDRPTTLEYAELLLEDFLVLHGDRIGAECPALVAGIGRFHDHPVLLLGLQKGHRAEELVAHGYGRARPEGYRKAARLMRLAEKLGLPVVTLIDTQGAEPGTEAEEHGQAVAVAENLKLMAGLRVPIVAVVVGEGGSGGALALGVADRVLIFENGFYSVITPEGCAAILWRDPAGAAEAAAALHLDAPSLLRLGVVDGVLPEPAGGSQADAQAAALTLDAVLANALAELATIEPDELVRSRRRRFRRYGAA